MTMNDTWGYKSYDQNWKSTETIIRNLVDIASKGGNYLLNVGPTPQGLIPESSVVRLTEVGRWMKVNGEAIYATHASPFKRLPWGRCTQKTVDHQTTLYLHVFNWPDHGVLLVPGLKNQAEKAYLLGDRKKHALASGSGAEGLTIFLPETAPDPISTTIVLKIKGPVEVEQPGLVQNGDGSVFLPAVEARVHGDQLRYESGSQRDNLGFWLNADDWADWEFSVRQAGKFAVSADLAAVEGAGFELSLGTQKLTGSAPATGDYGKFQLSNVGTLEIKSSGKVRLAVHPIKEGWHPINLKSIQIKPIQ